MELGDKSLNLVVVIAETGGLISRIQSIPEPGKIAGRFRSTLGGLYLGIGYCGTTTMIMK